MTRSRGLGWAMVFALSASAGCSAIKKAKECSALASTVSDWMAEAPKEDPSASAPERIAADARKTARRYEELDRRLAALNVRSKALIAPVASYRSLALESARVLDEVAGALERNDTELARRRRVEFDGTKGKEQKLVAEINGVCRK